MTIKERCKTAEAKLEEISTALLDYRPETLEACEAELEEIARLLSAETLEPSERPVASDRPVLMSLRKKSAFLGLQVQQAESMPAGRKAAPE
jgi:hypothetical protein